ncbi:MAG: glycosyltransferase family 25 protein [Chitinophagaceae bacterium]|nr:glycosyltransferase family 25 protein [Chitinophagaceae bacterium]MBL0272786.1 glycosyltransferase family 25 protein [Chitinophagaceae bacterium]
MPARYLLFVFTFVVMADLVPEINKRLHQYFDKVFVLTVPRFKERQQKVQERLAGILFEFFYGVDKNDLDAEFIARNYKYDKKNSLAIRQVFKELNTGEIACALSHRTIYQAMVDNGWKRVLIFEDDVVPDFVNLPQLFQTLKELPDNWELFYLGYLKNEKRTPSRQLKQFWYTLMGQSGLSRMPLQMIKNRLPRKFSSLLLKAGFHDCTHAYAVSLEGAKKLLQAQTPVTYRADNLLSALVLQQKLHAFISKDFLFNQEIFMDQSDKSYVRVNKK